MKTIKALPKRVHWLWAMIASVLMFFGLSLISGKLTYASFTANFNIASYLVICASGQMIVMTTGRGAFDLSIPNMITLSAFITMGMINGDNRLFFPILLLVVLVGAAVGMFNSFLVIKMRIPAMIATLAVGYILSTFTQVYNRFKFSSMTVCGIMKFFVTSRILGIPVICYVVVGMVFLLNFLCRSTTYGRSLAALGQNKRASELAGIQVNRVEMIAYIISAVLAALCGFFLSGRTGGAFLGMGDNYLMETVGSVVIGGTIASGGRAEPIGTLFGALFLSLVVTAMSAANFSMGMQNFVKGLIIVFILVLSSSRSKAD